MRHQRTIAKPCSLQGIGLHSGEPVEVIFQPAAPNSGINFLVAGNFSVPANYLYVDQVFRTTSLKLDDHKVVAVEHILAALSGLEIDNITIELKGSNELPALDGSSLEFVEALEAASIASQDATINYYTVSEPLWVSEPDKLLIVLPDREALKVSFYIYYSHHAIGSQFFSLTINEASFKGELSGARTFGFLEEADELRKLGLIKGASEANVLVIDKRGLRGPLRYPEELVRHKILDLLGDLALLGKPVRGHILAIKSGHSLNMKLIQKILESEVIIC